MNIKEIQTIAQKDKFTNDKTYNKGLKLVRESIGLSVINITKEIRYWMLCNNLN